MVKGFRHIPSRVAVIAIIGSFFLFNGFNSIPVYAASDISVSNSGKVSFGKVSASSTGTLATGEDTLSIATDCEAGANVYATSVNGSSTGTSLINLAAKEQDESSNGGTGVNPASYTINTSSATIGSASALANNTWGLNTNMMEAGNGSFYGLPEYSASGLPTVIYSGTNTELPIYYGAKVTNSLAPGTYTGEVLYTVTVNNSCLDYTVKFDKNASSASGDMSDQSILPTGGTLSENSFTYSGYSFLGWSLDPAGKTGTAENGIGTAEDANFEDKASFPGSNESILPGSETTLYAIWEKAMPAYFQMSNSCGTIPTNNGDITKNTGTLIDSRDNQEYAIYHFPNIGTAGVDYPIGLSNYCLMIQDLSLGMIDGPNASGTNTSISKIAEGENIDIRPTDSEFIPPTSGYWEIYYQSNSWSKDNIRQYTVGPSPNNDPESVHGYYSYAAATIVCPKGWRLPTKTEYDNIITFMGGNTSTGSNNIRTNPYNFLYGGIFAGPNSIQSNGGYINVGDFGQYWSSDMYTNDKGYYLYLRPGGLTTNDTSKYLGLSVRCVAEATNGTMQNFNANDIDLNQNIKLIDERDYSVYTVKKFSDGSIWMTSNLRLGYDKKYILTSGLTNIPDTTRYYLPEKGTQNKGLITEDTEYNSATFAANASDDRHAKVAYAEASNTGSTNPQDTGYYNFYTATLGCSSYNDGNSNCISGYISRDICPTGWQLPTGNQGPKSWYYFYNTLNNQQYANLISNSEASLPYSGYYRNRATSSLGIPELANVGSDGHWWSSTVRNSSSSYSLNLTTSTASPTNTDNKYLGYAVRCIAKDQYTVNYDANGGSGKMKPSRGYIGGGFTLSKNTFTRDGYRFAGWSTNPSATTATYFNGATISSNLASAGGSVTLYALWTDTIYLQTEHSCSFIPTDNHDVTMNTGTLVDSRDGQEYSIYHFPSTYNYPSGLDNYCIMTQDLSLGMVDGPNASGADSTKSQVARGGNMVLRPTDSTFDPTYTSGDSWTINYVDSANNGTGWSDNNDQSNKQYTFGPNPGYEAYSTHGYYSWGAALVSCPKGWRLPTNTEYNSLLAFMKDLNTATNSPYNFILGGTFYERGYGEIYSRGNYWSSVNASTYMSSYSLLIGNSFFQVSETNKRAGISVRCISQP